MKILATYFLLVGLASTATCEQIKGIFYYTRTAICTGSCIIYPPSLAASPAHYIFDTDSQQVKVFNFVESEIQFDYDRRTFEVNRRSGNEPILTQSELTDLSICEWKLHAEYIDEYDINVIGECTFREDGSWSYATQYLFGPHGFYGDIVAFDNFTAPEIETSKIELSVHIGNNRAYLRITAPLGLKHKLYRCTELGNWEEATLPGPESVNLNLTDTGHIISSGIGIGLMTEYLSSVDSAFYKVEPSQLEFTD
jgi:hypothetical protein